ncbi:hypothetical protein HMPREF1148_0202 [Selenomonas sp. FOBRC6]|uniref:hypothetical protein n=1 Tax=Selenomonas sp. FOBRC6 TaxID=936572 RepID=UPI00027819B1|nr:hypothetical protein [Selenomonas sp. FOBRC6]EJO22704.1 hypothetical protein HMPREF1148_0202 [Selenomonas sp. FOBRC6]
MAKMLKKLQQKITPPEKPKAAPPPGKDYLLLILMAFTVMVVIAAWENLDTLTLTMYMLLTLSLGLTYTRRHAVERLTETQMMIVTRASFVTIGMAGALFLIDAYRRFFA